MKVLTVTLVFFSFLTSANAETGDPLMSLSDPASLDESVHTLKPGESILLGDQKVVCQGSSAPDKTKCFASAQYTGEICCQVVCYYPKVARCRPPGHPSICRGAVCQCENQ